MATLRPERPNKRTRYLLNNEISVVRTNRHWVVWLPAFTIALVGLVLAGYLSGQTGSGRVRDAVWLLALGALCYFGYRWLEWYIERFIVTNRRILLISGLVTRRVAIMPLVKVTDMTYERPLWGQIFGYGTFIMESAGQDQALHEIKFVPRPEEVYEKISTEIFGTPRHPPSMPLPDRPLDFFS